MGVGYPMAAWMNWTNFASVWGVTANADGDDLVLPVAQVGGHGGPRHECGKGDGEVGHIGYYDIETTGI